VAGESKEKSTGGNSSGVFNKKEGDTVVELDNFKQQLSSFEQPLIEVRDSL